MTTTGDTPMSGVHVPRISTLHLMMWTLCSAVYLTFVGAIHSLRGLPEEYAAMVRAITVLQGIIAGAVLTGAIVLADTRFRYGPPLLRHPGHWLILISAVLTVVYLPLSFLFALLERPSFSIYAVGGMAAAIAYVIAARQNKQVRWRTMFGALAVQGVFESLSWLWLGLLPSLPREALYWERFFLSGWVVIVSLLDLMADQRRDWLHWTGVVTCLATTAGVPLILMIGNRLIQP